ncbi:MAG: ATP-binding protein [Paracoccus sp. (in: a-proteobacteria)]|uniref:sensor histidine kinase NtrY-like n=1 Tax=Paracoccus sp. TaxID=267 RepID=UPI0026E0C537|nr:ATP-binding protein [Paracoccus sp. (in: a-proteobacteria)]MDO5620429.1 ATP-binding protein [Paracoccus sp. (in: a-proteobacteria)]
MAASLSRRNWDRLARLRRARRVQNGAALLLVVLGPLLAALTYAVMGPLGPSVATNALRLVLLADLIYLIVLGGLMAARLVRMLAEGRRSQAGSRLHLRLASVFTVIALVPTVLVAVFAGLTVNIGLEGWFSSRVQQVVTTSMEAAVAYQDEHRRDLGSDARALGIFIAEAGRQNPLTDDGVLRQLLVDGQGQIQRGLREAFIIDGGGSIRARGERSYLFSYEQPGPDQIAQARSSGIALIEDWQNNEFRALVPLDPLVDRLLYVTRDVDGSLLGLLDDTRATVGQYQQLEATRGRVLFEFSLLYLGFALLLVAAAIWLGLWFAERLSRPIGRLAEASERVGAGDLDVQIVEPDTGDEIQTLGASFNRMTRQLKQQRAELVESYRLSDDQRRLFDSVLTSVTSGVVGLDAAGEIDFLNRSATRLLGLDPERDIDAPLRLAVPEFAALFDKLESSVAETMQDEIRLTREGRSESLLVRMARRQAEGGELAGYVVAFDDVTELVSAQRMAAWGDVARRVAHEIKNPLTPIQLSAERLRRKFAPIAGDQREQLDSYVDVIIRQTGDLRRIVDEFSRFARMPEPDRKETDIVGLLRESALLQQDALGGALQVALPDHPVTVDCDAGMMAQVFTNLLKNAGEAVEEHAENATADWRPAIRVDLSDDPETVTISVTDNGIGLPEDRARLFDPYVTLKSTGTGLGLPICKKIVEEHGGSLILTDAPEAIFGQRGALARITLPRERHPVRSRTRKSGQTSDLTPDQIIEQEAAK